MVNRLPSVTGCQPALQCLVDRGDRWDVGQELRERADTNPVAGLRADAFEVPVKELLSEA
jgi:hypothetical protein